MLTVSAICHCMKDVSSSVLVGTSLGPKDTTNIIQAPRRQELAHDHCYLALKIFLPSQPLKAAKREQMVLGAAADTTKRSICYFLLRERVYKRAVSLLFTSQELDSLEGPGLFVL